ncbi:pirin family protein [Flavobacterium amniphilum]|uniref:pirin family protein n=1 Tax=Flavobacterium amniphilum TaxID=1834035 RepID=UPI002029E831|nr:pirin family protein [Flavobacterium amniphilum]MCL9806981.1 pirin family protein [Flavobacterium amniphilum]
MENFVLHKAASRGQANHGWLESYHTFSFANYYNPERMNFGVLRVLNDDRVSAGMGFGTHSHKNMEIISIPLEGDLEHKDNMGNSKVIKEGDIQVMSAGSGISHSEYNKNQDKLVKFLQIWITPNKIDVEPRYQQITLDKKERINKFQQVLSPNPNDEGVWIYQDAWLHLGSFDKNITAKYELKNHQNGVYFFIIEGKATIDGNKLDTRDGLGIWNTNQLNITIDEEKTEILIMEVSMLIN